MQRILDERKKKEMKRLFAILLVLCLILCRCEVGGNTPTKPNTPGQSGGEQTNDPTSGQSGEPTRPAEVEMVDFNAPALNVKITINPELELTLSRTNEILDVKALNADAESLLASLDLVGQLYERGIVTILEEAKEQKYLKDVSKVTITAEELSDGAWTIITGELLTKPIEDYQQHSGIVFSCRLTPAGESLDIDELKVIETSRNGDVFVTVYGDAAGNAQMMIYESDDGTRQEVYMISDTEEIGIHYYPDGSYRYGHNDGLVDQGYWIYPDGSGFTYVGYMELVDGLLQTVWYQRIYFDGSAEEYFYEDSEFARTIFTDADGTTWEAFYENGTIVSEVWKDADGNILEESGGNGDSAGSNSDGSTFEQTFYPNGNLKTYNTTWPNGDYSKQNYYENGNVETYTESREGRYVEGYYDENGLMVSLFQREPDGTEYDWDYENGEAVGYTVTYPDGSSEYHSYSP